MNYARIANGVVVETLQSAAAPVMHPALVWVADPSGDAVVGWTYADNAFVAPVVTLAQAQAAKLQALAVALATKVAAGFTWNAKLYQIDNLSQQNITSMGSLAAASLAPSSTVAWPGGFVWIAADNSQVAMSAAQMLAFAAAIATYVSALILNAAALKATIAAAGTVVAANAIDLTAGWPAASGP